MNSVIRYHASQYKDIDRKFPEKVAKIFYVDDFNWEETLVLMFVNGKQNIFVLINWKRKSISGNSKIQNNDKIKVLGIEWDTINNYFIYSFEELVESFKSVIPTKPSINYYILRSSQFNSVCSY